MTTGQGIAALVFFGALWAVIELAERVCGWATVKRHRYDGLADPRVLDPIRRRLSADEMRDVGDGY